MLVKKYLKRLKGKLEKYSLPMTRVVTNKGGKFNRKMNKRLE